HSRPTEERIRVAEQLAELDAFLCVPLKTKSGIVGLLLLGEKTSRDIYTAEDVTMFSTLAGPLGAAIENARLYRKIEEVNLHLERIMDNMRGGVIAVDVNGVITTVNQGARDILGKINVGDRMDGLRPPLADLLRRTLAEQRSISDFETVIAGPDGERIPVLLSASLLARSEWESLGAMALLFNLTQIKRLEANVQRADRLSSLGTVAAGMAHEIKNPLVSIRTFTQLLPTRYQDPEFRASFSEIVLQEVDRINTIVSRLLDFARPRPVQFAPQNLHRILSDTLALIESQTRKSNIKVNAVFPEKDREVSGDEQQLHQVFLNLLLNAIEALQESRERQITVTMRYDRAHLRRKDAPPLFDAECVKVSIADTGCGIPQDALDQVFTPFFTTKANGSGLGLSVVQGIVTSHGGVIDVSSIPGMGTLFTVTFPLMTAGRPAQRQTQ
ncbi:MAG TPA: ATP-binding protein, partial [Candidatus Hydrogenedentes bacterium]|nr:ATP-binding protein [Candidatus Hydrogenedentota bacterium]